MYFLAKLMNKIDQKVSLHTAFTKDLNGARNTNEYIKLIDVIKNHTVLWLLEVKCGQIDFGKKNIYFDWTEKHHRRVILTKRIRITCRIMFIDLNSKQMEYGSNATFGKISWLF